MTAFFLWACSLLAAASDHSPNVVLLSVDTLRADMLSCYGCPWPTSPHLDRFAEEALLFDDVQCEIPLTGPSFAAMFTGRYPREVGMTRNGLDLPDSMTTITSAFRQAGYYCFAVQSNWTLKGKLCGLDRDFHVYDDHLPQRRWGIYRGERRAEEVLKAAGKQLAACPADQPFFAWIHFSDPHAPYRFRKNQDPGRSNFRKLSKKEITRAKYASEVNYTDRHIGALLKLLPQDCQILFVADHGESLHDHGYLGHGRHVYSECTRVPLMIRASGMTPGKCSFPAQTLDVGTTLLALAGLSPLPGARGVNLCEVEGDEGRVRFMESYGGLAPDIPGVRQLVQDTEPLRRAVMKEGWKLHVMPSQPSELYYLPDDPGEEHNLRAHHSERVSELKALLDQWEKSCPRDGAESALLDEADLDALRSLGYLD